MARVQWRGAGGWYLGDRVRDKSGEKGRGQIPRGLMKPPVYFPKLDGFKQQKCSPSHFQRAEIQNQLHWVNIQGSVGLCSLGRLWRRISSQPLPESDGYWHQLISATWLQPTPLQPVLASPLLSALSSSVCGTIPFPPGL